MIVSRLTTPLFVVVLLSSIAFAFGATAQTLGTDQENVEPPEQGLPGEASVPPPTAGPEVHLTDEDLPTGQPQALPSEELSGDWSVTVNLRHATNDDADLSDLPVFLNALRPQGPFQAGGAQPVATWTSTTDSNGVAEFSSIPEDIAQRGLRLQAASSFEGISFESSQSAPADKIELNLNVYDRGHDLSGLRVTQKRIVVEPWEEYLIISQFWTFELHGDHAVDIGLSPDPTLQRGLPIRLPRQAEGIHFSGPGDHEVINNVVFWNTVLQPNRPVQVQIRFSKSVRGSELTYQQLMEFPVDEIQIVAPIQTQYEKIPRLNQLALLAPGFEVGADAGALGLRSDMEFLVATGRDFEAGDSYTFRVEGLPFRRPIGGWIAVIGGILGAIFVLAYGRREYKNLHDDRSRKQLLDALRKKRSAVLDELAELRVAIVESYDEEVLFDLEEEETLLRERLALILRKIRDLEADDELS